MIIRPSIKTFGIEGKMEIIENNLIILKELYDLEIINNVIYDKMVKLIKENDN